MYQKTELTKLIKEKALEVGFDAVGISKAQEIKGFSTLLQQWIDAGYHGNMDYINRNKEKRADPTILVENSKSVISFLISYYPEQKQSKDVPQIAKYAYGTDYHFVLKDKMQEIWDYIKTIQPQLDGRMFVDSAPISDKLLAVNAGLGWIGKNSCLINRKLGSFVFICELIINIELNYDKPYTSNYCGNCTKCIDACPTNAIVKPGVINSNKCISYITIENKDNIISKEFNEQIEDRLFGCDICQDICPWNKKPFITTEKEFQIKEEILTLKLDDWKVMEPEKFNRIFKKSALKRAKLSGIQRNAKFLDSSK